MNHRKLVLPGHMNDQGSLFGGYLLQWLDEFAYITANMEFPVASVRYDRAEQCRVQAPDSVRTNTPVCRQPRATRQVIGRVPRRGIRREISECR